MPQTIVLSALNITNGGPLTIARDLLATFLASPALRAGELRLVVFCSDAALFREFEHTAIEYIAIPAASQRWSTRLWYEYYWFYQYSKTRAIDLWLSLVDTTPRVLARRRMTYCHNATPFYSGPSQWLREPAWQLKQLLYRQLLRINLHCTAAVIVQQQWFRDAFVSQLGCDPQRVIVARPQREAPSVEVARPPAMTGRFPQGRPLRLLYASLPRFFKNFEVVLDAVRLLPDVPLELTLTVAGNENRYARQLFQRAQGLEDRVRFVGLLAPTAMKNAYDEHDALVFASTLESWGLPLSEFQPTGKPILAADLPYAHEALSDYSQAAFFDPNAPAALAQHIRAWYQTGQFAAQPTTTHYAQPFARDWPLLLATLGLWETAAEGRRAA